MSDTVIVNLAEDQAESIAGIVSDYVGEYGMGGDPWALIDAVRALHADTGAQLYRDFRYRARVHHKEGTACVYGIWDMRTQAWSTEAPLFGPEARGVYPRGHASMWIHDHGRTADE
ncbi:hypothetical protein [Streptomyces chryseus]|uniref:hypothetical protein n=1 Tax=Streptomyces chryseus TaxID=68186 RepID=UPI00110FEF2F|nr:hypothetical protein [Streptomyces chryseus]GGX26627.1 hypothetical protein GCM10010353_47100 [Streptomyces chryseus]